VLVRFFFVNLAGNLNRFLPGQRRAPLQRPSDLFWFSGQKGGREMLKQRFFTHFKPWLIGVSKAGGVIVAYQFLDQIRMQLQRPPLNIFDVVAAATIALSTLGLICCFWAWGEWCCFKLHRFRGWTSRYKLAVAIQRGQRRLETSRPR
jgi:hypothetical protein